MYIDQLDNTIENKAGDLNQVMKFDPFSTVQLHVRNEGLKFIICTGRLDSLMVRAFNLRLDGRDFDSRPPR